MGLNFATELADMDTIPFEQKINMHLQYNFYPPVPSSMVIPCMQAIDAYYEDDQDREIEMPQGVSYRGKDTAPAYAIIEQHRLYSFIEDEDYVDDEWLEDEE